MVKYLKTYQNPLVPDELKGFSSAEQKIINKMLHEKSNIGKTVTCKTLRHMIEGRDLHILK